MFNHIQWTKLYTPKTLKSQRPPFICSPLQEPEQQNGFHPPCIKGEDVAATRTHSQGDEASRNKKAKLETVPHSDCDTDSDLEEDMQRVTNLLTAGGGSPGNTHFSL